MSLAQKRIFSNTRSFSSLATTCVLLLSLLFSQLIDESTITWQVVIALIALAIGIPHGALDHLVTLPRSSVIRMTLFIAIYVAIAIIAVWAILNWNIAGFIAVVAMSALHFGIGDAAFISEMDRSANQSASPRIAQFSYAASAGLMPVIIPLTNQMSTSALNAVNPALLNWHGGYAEELNNLVTIFFLLALSIQIFSKRYRDGLDLSILFLLATLTPPLVAFAAYFGLWHAMRHTARLTLNLKSSQNFVREGNSAKAFLQAILPGLPALVGTSIVSLALAALSPERLSDELLWLSLVVVWALTVPHMIVTARLDKAAFK
jgi:Brp/Blh family beta-carotene 15,15'-monooxygenase